MKTKITALLCALTLAFTPVSAKAAQTSAEDELRNSLTGLGILSWAPMSKISKGAFVYSLAGFLYDDVKNLATAEEAARSIGLIGDGEAFDESARITTAEAVKYAVITLGYREKADDADYTAMAASAGITSGVNLSNKYLENSDGLKILENLLDAQPITGYASVSGEVVYRTESDKTLISKNRDIYEVKGIVTANGRTSIYSEKGAKDGIIKIDGEEYLYSGKDDLLGNNVLAYVRKERNEDAEIVYMGATSKNRYLTIDAEDVQSVSDDFSKLVYKNGKSQKTVKLALAPKVIYNGIFCGGYTKADFLRDNGSLDFVDYDNDGMYDVVFITAYETVVVSSADYSKMEFSNKYTYAGALSSFKIEDEDEYEIYKNTEAIEIGDINIGDVLSVAISKNATERYIVIQVSDRNVEGVLKARDDDEKVFNVEGKEYGVKKSFLDYMRLENKVLSVGNEYNFVLDAFGNLADFETFAKDGYVMGLRVRETDDGFVLVYMDMDGDWHNGALAEKVRLNDGDRISAQALYNTLSTMEPQIMIITTNSKGEIKTVETALNSGAYNKDRLTKYESTMTYYSQSLSFAHSVHLEDTAKLVVFPSSISYNKGDYYVKDASGYFTADSSYTVTVYDVDEYNFTPLVSIKGTGSKLSRSLFIITSIMQECDSDGAVHSVAYGNIGSFRDFVFSSKDEKFVDSNGTPLNIKAGDIINVSVDRHGYVDEASIVYSLNQTFVQQGSIAHNSNSIISGIIEDIDIGKLRMKVKAGGSEYIALSNSLPVQVYSKGDRTCELKTVSELKRGSKVVMQFNWGEPIACVVVEE